MQGSLLDASDTSIAVNKMHHISAHCRVYILVWRVVVETNDDKINQSTRFQMGLAFTKTLNKKILRTVKTNEKGSHV